MEKVSKKGAVKGAMQFGWIFAIIVGAVILFLTFFFLARQIFVQDYTTGTITVRGIDLLLGPFTYIGSVAEITSDEISLTEKTKLGFDCEKYRLGYSVINIIDESTVSHNIYDKYIFAEEMETKKITVISKPFEMPFRIADLIYLAKVNANENQDEADYCFVRTPIKVEYELNDLNMSIEFQNSVSSCSENAISVCFDVSGYCDVKVSDKSTGIVDSYEIGEVRKDSGKMYYASRALMYGAIFSSKDVYDCNVARLMSRTDTLISIYKEKARDASQKGCDENYHLFLTSLENAASNVEADKLSSFVELYNAAQSLDNLNQGARCRLF